MQAIKVVGIDLDGTLYESTPAIQGRIRRRIYEKLAEEFKLPVELARERFEDGYARLSSGRKAIEEMARNCGRSVNGSDLVQDSIEEAAIVDLIEPNLLLRDMLERIRRRVELDLVTGSRRALAGQKLDRLGIDACFFTYILADEDGSKSHGDMYDKWIALRELAPGEHLYAGDNKKQDVEIPKAKGIRTCFLGQDREVVSDFRIGSILELEGVIAQA